VVAPRTSWKLAVRMTADFFIALECNNRPGDYSLSQSGAPGSLIQHI
jgi:hypothetical protein